MPVPVEDTWSDSDDDELAEVETSVLLGVPDGPMSAESDLADAAVSRIGGHPAFLTASPPLDSSHCKRCNLPMELLVQLWCPLEDSPMDRALYVWGCSRSACQKKDGSVRAWRGLRLNEEYAAKLAKKKAREPKPPPPPPVKVAPKANPFSVGASAIPSPFGLGAQVFGATTAAPSPPAPTLPSVSNEEPEETHEQDNDSANEEDEEEELVIAMAATTLESSPWVSTPAYLPLYLSTTAEYLPPPPKAKVPSGVRVGDELDDEGKPAGGWAPETYENSMDLDQVFERFVKRVSAEGQQCIRYELGGTPLPFSSDKVFDTLFPAPKATSTIVGKDMLVQSEPPRRTFTTAAVPRCTMCGAERVFECQLMPNLINVTRAAASAGPERKPPTDEERRQEVRAVLAGEGERSGMGWGTCMVFSCENDCRGKDGTAKEIWTEESVFVQWED